MLVHPWLAKYYLVAASVSDVESYRLYVVVVLQF
jgi:hypothetical protein